MPFRDEKVRRIGTALLENLQSWAEQADSIALQARPNSKLRRDALHLEKSLLQAKIALERLLLED